LAYAAIGKRRAFGTFVAYLSVPFHRYARRIAFAVLSIEAILSVALAVFGSQMIVLLSIGAFLLVASLYIALRLVLSDRTDCSCFGGGSESATSLDDQTRIHTRREIVFNALQPAWYGLRNSLLLLGVWRLLLDTSHQLVLRDNLTVLAISSVCALCILVGLIASIGKKRWLLTRDEHPLRNQLAPRLYPLVALSWYMGNQNGGGWQLVHGKDIHEE